MVCGLCKRIRSNIIVSQYKGLARTNLNVAPRYDALDKKPGWVVTQGFGDHSKGDLAVH
jgi:hypothetical protein